MNELKVLRRENARLRLENTAQASKIRELEEALAVCKRRFGIKIEDVLDGDGNGPSPTAVADAARRLDGS